MNLKNTLVIPVLACLIIVLGFAACSDERTEPAAPEQPSYNETRVILDRVVSGGEEVTAEFVLPDVVTGGKLILFGFIQPDDDVDQLDQLNGMIDSLSAANDSISALIFDRWVEGTLTEADSLDLEAIKTANDGLADGYSIQMDELDSWLDDRYKLSIWLDDDTTPIYPLAVQLDSTTTGDHGKLDYLADSTIVWGQGYYLVQEDDDGWRGKRIELDFDEFWIADPSWEHPQKPSRSVFLNEPAAYPDRYTQFELLPMRTWLARLTPDTPHTLHFRFGGAGTVTELSASLYLIYEHAD